MASQQLEMDIAKAIADYVCQRAVGLGLKPDATLAADPLWHGIIDEACAVLNVAVFWAKTAGDVWTQANGPLASAAPQNVLSGVIQQAAGAVPSLVSGVLAKAQAAGA